MNTWIQAVRMYNKDHPATRWIMPVKGGEPYKEVKALQAAEKPEAKRAKALAGLRKVEAEAKARNVAKAAEEQRAKALTGLRKVEAEAKARNLARAAAAKPSEYKPLPKVAAKAAPKVVESVHDVLAKEFKDYKRIIEDAVANPPDETFGGLGRNERAITAREWILTRQKHLKEPKHKELYDALKGSELMTYVIPKAIMNLKRGQSEDERIAEQKAASEKVVAAEAAAKKSVPKKKSLT